MRIQLIQAHKLHQRSLKGEITTQFPPGFPAAVGCLTCASLWHVDFPGFHSI